MNIFEKKDHTDHAFVSKAFTEMEVDVFGKAERVKDGLPPDEELSLASS